MLIITFLNSYLKQKEKQYQKEKLFNQHHIAANISNKLHSSEECQTWDIKLWF